MLAPSTHLKTMSPKLETMSRQNYGKILGEDAERLREEVQYPSKQAATHSSTKATKLAGKTRCECIDI